MTAFLEKKPLLILMRHGQSVWNQKNLFTGWVDIPLSEKGIKEALEGGEKIKKIPLDVIFTSSLIRAHMTLLLAMLPHASKKVPVFIHEDKKRFQWSQIHYQKAEKGTIPVYSSWKLNERMYGNLQGMNKEDARKQYGKEQVKIWRRSFDIAPPEGESLKDTAKRALPFFFKNIEPFLQNKKTVFLVAHGNSLRAILMKLENLDKKQILELEIPTGEPIIYRYQRGQYTKVHGNFF